MLHGDPARHGIVTRALSRWRQLCEVRVVMRRAFLARTIFSTVMEVTALALPDQLVEIGALVRLDLPE